MSTVSRPKPPQTLRSAGKALWTRMHAALPDDLRFGAKELELLRRAGALADREHDLAAAIKTDGLMTTGSTGQLALHPAVAELRQVERALCDLLARISLDDTSGQVRSPRSERASKAAHARWAPQNELAERRTRLKVG